MRKHLLDDSSRGATKPFRQWQFEEAVNGLRRRVDETAVRRHWCTTGHTTIDATARAHVAEWRAIDGNVGQPEPCRSVTESIVERALAASCWDLYVIEDRGSGDMAVRRLRDGRGRQIRWLEGRNPPPIGAKVALRVKRLEPPGLDVATLPIVFGDAEDADAVVQALLRAYGDRAPTTWSGFMKRTGGRIVIEHGLARLNRLAGSIPAGGGMDSGETGYLLRQLDEAFSRLEAMVHRHDVEPPGDVVLDDGRFAWLEDIAAGPHLLVFDGREDWRRYRRTAAVGGLVAPDCEAKWCRVRRVDCDELSSVERTLADGAGLDVESRGLVRLRRRGCDGRFVDPDEEDHRAVRNACQLMSSRHKERAA